jgi:hypothetical protein
MKKLLFGLIAIVMFGNLSFGQNNNPSNPQNEFDYVGKIHNEGLDKIINSESEKNLFNKNPKDYCVNLLIANNVPTEGYISIIENKDVIRTLGELNINNINLTPEKIKMWYDNKYVSSGIADYLAKLLVLTEKYYNDFDYEYYKSNVIKLEEQAYNLKNDDKVVILSTASIARHTVSFWSNNTSNLSRYRGTPRGLGLADLAGAVGGAIRTYAMCVFTGPVGWGVWAGSIVGVGLATSAAYVIVNH